MPACPPDGSATRAGAAAVGSRVEVAVTDPRLLALCFGNFVIGTGTLIVPGMLSALAQGLRVDLPSAGRLIAAFAAVVCVGAPLLAALTSRIDRRALLVAMQLVFAGGHLAAMLAPGYDTVLATRVVSAVSAAVFPAQAAAVAGLLVEPSRRGSAIAFVFLGWSVASVLGVPLGAWIGESLGWRAGFGLVAVLAAVSGAAVWKALPAGLRTQPVDRAAWAKLARDSALLVTLGITAIQAWAQFTVFSYVTPAFKSFVGAGPALVSVLLALFGAAGIAGNVAAVRLIDRAGATRVVAVALVLMLCAHLAWRIAPGSLPLLVAALLLWGLGCFSVNSAQQARLVALSPALAPVSVALNTSGIYFGQAAGAETGGRIIDARGIEFLPYASVPLFVLSLAVAAWAGRLAARRAAGE